MQPAPLHADPRVNPQLPHPLSGADGELIALLPARVHPAGAGGGAAEGGGAVPRAGFGGAAPRGGFGGAAPRAGFGGAAPRAGFGVDGVMGRLHAGLAGLIGLLPAGLLPQHVAAAAVSFLVLVLGWPMLQAGLLASLLMCCYLGATHEGGPAVAARDAGAACAAVVERATGQQLTPPQALVLVATAVCIASYFLVLAPARGGSSYSSSSYGYSGRGAGGSSRRRAGDNGYDSGSGGSGARGGGSYGFGGGQYGGEESYGGGFLSSMGALDLGCVGC